MQVLVSLAGSLCLGLLAVTCVAGFDAFDTHDVPEEAELLYIDIYDMDMDDTVEQPQAYPGGDDPQGPFGYPVPNDEYDILRDRVLNHPKVKATRGLPSHVSATLVCRGVPVHLELHHYYNTGTDGGGGRVGTGGGGGGGRGGTGGVGSRGGRGSGMVMENNMYDMLNSRTGRTSTRTGRTSRTATTLSDGEIPVFTRGTGPQTPVVLDDFPRLYGSSCRTLRDYRNQAYFLLIEDPEYSSFKFLGSFVMGGHRYFIEPYASTIDAPGMGQDMNTGRQDGMDGSRKMRAHVSTQLPDLNFEGDLGWVSLSPNTAASTTDQAGLRGFPHRGVAPERQDQHHVMQNFLEKMRREDRLASVVARNPMTQSEPLSQSSSRQQILDRLNAIQSDNTGRGRRRRNKSSRRSKRSTGSTARSADVFSDRNDTVASELNVRHHRVKRQAGGQYNVEVFVVCDYLCYLGFQRENSVTDETATKNAILQFFQLVQEALKTAYVGIETRYSQLGLSMDSEIVGVYIATTPDDKIIGDYVIGDANEIDTSPSLYEFAIWVQDTMKVSLSADHYALVTGYDLAGQSRDVIGQVTRVPSVCDIDRVSVNELLIRFLPITIVHELGHTLGALHDGDTNGVCRDRGGFVMAASASDTNPNSGAPGQFSECSAMFFSSALRQSGSCLRRDDFRGQALPSRSSIFGRNALYAAMTPAVTSQDKQCGLFYTGSTLCREVYEQVTWGSLCAARACSSPSGGGAVNSQGQCFVTGPSMDFTSCGNRKWCQGGVCVRSAQALALSEDCLAGDMETFGCDARRCSSYDDVTRFLNCCETCKPMKTERFVTLQF